MAGTITQLIKLTGAEQVKSQLTAIGKEGEKAFSGIEKSATSASTGVAKVGQAAGQASGGVASVGKAAEEAAGSFLRSGQFATLAAGGIIGLGAALVSLAKAFLDSAGAAAKLISAQVAAAQKAGQTTKNFAEVEGTLKQIGLTADEATDFIKKFGTGTVEAFAKGRAELAKRGISFAPTVAGAEAASKMMANLGGEGSEAAKKMAPIFELMRQSGAAFDPTTGALKLTTENVATLFDNLQKLKSPLERIQALMKMGLGEEAARRIEPRAALGGDIVRKEAADIERLQNANAEKRKEQERAAAELNRETRRLQTVQESILRDTGTKAAGIVTPLIRAYADALDQFNKAKSDPNKPIFGDPSAGLFEVPPDAFQPLVDAANAAFNAILEGARKTAEAMRQILSSGGGSPALVPSGPGEFASGGSVRGPGSGTSDSILARVSNGEYVMKAAAVRHYGLQKMSAINALRMPRFDTGGLVAGLGRSLSAIAMPGLAAGGVAAAGPSGRPVVLNINGRSFSGFTGTDSAVKQVTKAATLGQISSAGRAPSWDS